MNTDRHSLAAENFEVIDRAVASCGTSSEPVYKMVAGVMSRCHGHGGTLVDVGCGQGQLRQFVGSKFDQYVGADVVQYPEFPTDAEFAPIDANTGGVRLPNGIGDVVAAVETIEHVENPRAFFRELCRLAKPGGLVVVTTPNQLSLLSLTTLVTKGQFNAFQEAPGLYPSHITALLEIDLRRIAAECRLVDVEVDYSGVGRVPFSGRHWPGWPIFAGRMFSDNLLISGRNTR